MELNYELARQSFEAALKVQEAETLDELNAVMAPAVERLGFQHFVGIDVLGTGEQRRVRIVHGVNNGAWQDHYLASGFAKQDFAIDEVGAITDPFFRSELVDRRGGPSEVQARIIDEARSFGVRDSLFIPHHHVGGALSAIVFVTGEDVDRTPCARTAAHLLGVQYGLIARRLLRRDLRRICPGACALSRRQLECLKWVRAGKTSTEIGAILNLSGRTVEAYLAAACERLGVRTRVQAVARALVEGLLPA